MSNGRLVSHFSYFRGSPRGGGILVLEAGSSRIDFTLFAVGADRALARTVDGRLDQLYADARFHAEDASGLTVTDVDCADETPPGHRIAVEFLFNWLAQRAAAVPVVAVGHRLVHGGRRFSGPARIDAPTLRYLQALAPLAPARQRPCLQTIRVIAQRWPELPQVACFESAFYRDVPAVEHTLPLPRSISKRGIRRYGYDGLSLESVIDALPTVDERAARGKTIVVHVSDGVSLCALDAGHRVAIATGFGDLDGLPGRRSRRLDRISRVLESLAAALSGLDAIVFTTGTGPHAVPIRAGICRRASWLGVDFDPAANEAGGPRLTRPESRVTAWVIPTDERLLIARHTQAVVGRSL